MIWRTCFQACVLAMSVATVSLSRPEVCERVAEHQVSRVKEAPTKASQGMPLHPQASQVWSDPRTKIEYVYVPAGTIVVGTSPSVLREIARRRGTLSNRNETSAAAGNDEKPRPVALAGFWIGRYEVTQEQYAAFLKANPNIPAPSVQLTGRFADKRSRKVESRYEEENEKITKENYACYIWNDKTRQPPISRRRHPVVLVEPGQASAFCRWAGGRLPTEAEWERAAGWGDTPITGDAYWGWYPLGDWREVEGFQLTDRPRAFPWGNEWHFWCNCAEYQYQGDLTTESDYDSLWIEEYSRASHQFPESKDWYAKLSMPVGSFPHDRSIYGMYDAAGNVSEICSVGPVPQKEASTMTSNTARWVAKGGNFESPWWNCRVQSRADCGAGIQTGFRCVLPVKPSP